MTNKNDCLLKKARPTIFSINEACKTQTQKRKRGGMSLYSFKRHFTTDHIFTSITFLCVQNGDRFEMCLYISYLAYIIQNLVLIEF